MANVTGVNSQDFLKGARALVQIAPYIAPTAGVPTDATSTLLSLGFVDDVSFEASTEVKKMVASNCLLPVDGDASARDFGLKFTIKEARLRHFAQALMDDPAAGTSGGAEHDVNVTGGATYTAVLALDEPQALRYWQVQVTVADQSMLPAYTEDATTTYTKRKIVLYRCMVSTKTSAKLSKDGEWVVPVEVHPFVDTSITYTKGSYGRVGKITDSKT